MSTSVVYPYAKINIGLHVIEKRADGYHNIETVFYPVSMHDILEVTDAPEAGRDAALFTYGLDIPGDPYGNLCMKAYRLLAADFPLTPVEIHLYKNIPMGAGLGGGSSDAAFCIQLLNKHFGLNLTHAQLMHYALQLGSDVPFFLQPLPPAAYLAGGRGDLLTPIPLSLSNYRIELRFPPVSVFTAEAYAGMVPQRRDVGLRERLLQPIDTWKCIISNDFETTIFEKFPVIRSYKEALYDEGAVYASMTGSGSAVFGLFRI
ncbi:MAG: 4-(cytidine 5'-diphospho)-2-C-methyl-D-erythritol kinase [Bacteroidales bacterium]|jgi:4-diphosphocytidyl-2-C-methyl-D-erythritol kinase|nr:4-(cytidine 5'-diphospho)-2-C-methyl-D-erythritol kinase [Bacteroidales bacterium]